MSSTSLDRYSDTAFVADPIGLPRVSWGGILAGALVGVAVGATLNILGVALGTMAVDTVARSTPSASAFAISAGAWMLVSNLIGLALGGFVASRLSGTPDRADAMLHGLGVWAAAFLVSAVVLGSAVSGGVSAGASAVSGLASGAGGAMSSVASQVNPEEAIDRARMALTGPSDAARMSTEQRGAEVSGLIAKRVANGALSEQDRNRLNTLVAAEAGIPAEEAAQRVQAYEADAQRIAREAEEVARRAADATASATATASFWIFGTLLLGALAAILGARAGTRSAMLLPTRASV